MTMRGKRKKGRRRNKPGDGAPVVAPRDPSWRLRRALGARRMETAKHYRRKPPAAVRRETEEDHD